jgi:hypothetical protein
LSKSTPLEDLLLAQIREEGLPEPEREVCLIPGRKFRFDFVWRKKWGYDMIPGLTVEVQGGTWVKGGHSSGIGIQKDCEKTILAQLEGWKVFPVTSNQIKDRSAIEWIKKGLAL